MEDILEEGRLQREIDDILDEVEGIKKPPAHEPEKALPDSSESSESDEIPPPHDEPPEIPERSESTEDVNDLLDEVEKELVEERIRERSEPSETNETNSSRVDELLDEVESELECEREVADILDSVEREIREEDIDRILDEVEREVVEKDPMERPEHAPTDEDLERYESEQTGAKAAEEVVEGAPESAEAERDVEQGEVSDTSPQEEVIDPHTASLEDIEKTVEHHQHLDRKLKEEHRREYEDYKQVMTAPEDMDSEDIAQQLNRDVEEVEDWREKEKVPTAVRRVVTYEGERIVHESDVPDECIGHRIDPESVKEVLDEYRETESLSVSEKTELVERIYRPHQKEDSVVYAEFYERGVPLVEDRYREIASEIRAERGAIEVELNKRLGLDADPHREVRIAVTDSRVYYWNKDESPNRWLNVLYDQFIYFKTKEDKVGLIDETTRSLHIRGGPEPSEIYLNDLLGQLSRVEDAAANRTRRFGETHYFEGEIYHFMGDLHGKTLEDFTPMMSHFGVSERGRVDNLRWPEIREFRIRTVAIIESDGHLTPKEQLRYFEKEQERIDIVIKQFQKFGDFEVKKEFRKGVCKIELPMVFGAMMDYWEVPKGDKAIWNKGLAGCIKNETLNMKRKYKEEAISEDGCFSCGRFSIERGNVLHAGKEAERYEKEHGIKPLVGMKEIQFVKDHGEPMKAGLGYEEGERIKIKFSEIKELRTSENKTTAEIATSFCEVIDNNPNQLLLDEAEHIVKPFGIRFEPEPVEVYYYIKSERLSVKWRAYTTRKRDVCTWAFLSPPNHPRKMREVVKFIQENEDIAREVYEKLKRDGFGMHEKWDGWFK